MDERQEIVRFCGVINNICHGVLRSDSVWILEIYNMWKHLIPSSRKKYDFIHTSYDGLVAWTNCSHKVCRCSDWLNLFDGVGVMFFVILLRVPRGRCYDETSTNRCSASFTQAAIKLKTICSQEMNLGMLILNDCYQINKQVHKHFQKDQVFISCLISFFFCVPYIFNLSFRKDETKGECGLRSVGWCWLRNLIAYAYLKFSQICFSLFITRLVHSLWI